MEKSKRRLFAPAGSVPLRRSVGRALLSDRRGFSAAEYAAILAIIGAVIALAAVGIADSVGRRIALAEIRLGKAAFIKPEVMTVGGWYPVEFMAGPTNEALRAESEDLPLTTPRPIYVGQSMRVQLLKDPNFEMRAKSRALQQTGPDMTATWQWDVKPGAVGNHMLIAQVDVLKRRQDGRYDLFNRYSRRVSVHVTVGTMQGVIDGIRTAEDLGDALSALFRSWRTTLLTLCALVAAAFSVRWSIRKFRRRAPRPNEIAEVVKVESPDSQHDAKQ